MDSQGLIDLVERCKSRDRRAQFELYDKYKDSLYTLAKRMGLDDEKAAWALQDAFLAIFNSLHTYRNQSGIYAWMRSILIRSVSKTRKLLFNNSLEWNERMDLAEESLPDVDAHHLTAAFEQLTGGYRAVLTLYYLEDMKHKEIAELLSISEGTSKSQLFHAKKKLKEIMLLQNNGQ